MCATESAQISARGVVQGVGFRPFVYGLAQKYNLKGWVCNTSEDVRIEAEGDRESLEAFYADLRNQAPPLSHIESLSIDFKVPFGYLNFEIRKSMVAEGKCQLVSPDIATCELCRREIFSCDNRRYLYPFTNCTNCGPRFTIIEDMPYDRTLTTMRHFRMCPQCLAEYEDPLDKRFHAQPNACPSCGPKLELINPRGKKLVTVDVIGKAADLLHKGKILAVKGLGGFLLACDATDAKVVQQLRQRKRRPSKPFAVMLKGLDAAKKHCQITPQAEALLLSPMSPIVLLPWKADSGICAEVAPHLKFLGLMLPYTPLHYLLMDAVNRPLVMTSGNLSEEPIASDNAEALSRLAGIADYFLVHNREIFARYDDSVAFNEQESTHLLRRARGYAPFPIGLSFSAQQVLATGADEKNTFCLTRDNYAFVSQHIGDMENLETLEHFQKTLGLYQRLFRIKPQVVAYDMHPGYHSSKFALEFADKNGISRLLPVQHHHAHIASCMAENKLEEPVIGVAFDGTGYGTDGNIWGGEFMVADLKGFTRMGHLEYLPLPGGEISIKRPYRIAIAYMLQLLGQDSLESMPSLIKTAGEEEIVMIQHQLKSRINTPLTSSMGRLFDAVSALLGIRTVIDYDAQAAVELEMAAWEESEANDRDYAFDIVEREGSYCVKVGELLAGIVADLSVGMPKGKISLKFHNSVAGLILEMCLLIRQKSGLTEVAMSGGVFQNRLLLRKTLGMLVADGFSVKLQGQVPCNDGGISLGQAAIAACIHG